MGFNFANLTRGNVDPTRAAKFRVDVLPNKDGTCPELTVISSTEANRPYTNERLRATTRNKSRMRQIEAGKLNARHLQETRDEERALYAKHVVVDWDNVFDDAGQKVAFSTEACEAFLAALPDWIFDELLALCRNPANFADLPEDVAGAAKNSPSA